MPGSRQAVGLFWQQPRPGGDHEHVVAERRPVAQVHLVRGQVDPVYADLAEGDPGPQLPVPAPDDPAGIGEPERDEQQPGLIDVVVIPIDDDDLGVARAVDAP